MLSQPVSELSHSRTSSCSLSPRLLLCLGLGRLFKGVILGLFYLGVVNIHSVPILLFLLARKGRTGILMNDIHRWDWFLSCTHTWKIHGEDLCYSSRENCRAEGM